MVYSEAVDCVFCIACAVFCADPSKGKFVVQPFCLWHKGEKVKAHEHCSYHQYALEQSDLFKRSVEQPHTTITAQVDAHKAATQY